MSILGRFSISAKVLGLVMSLNVITLAVGAIGYYAVDQLQTESASAAAVSSRAFDAVVVNRALAAMSRAQFYIATDPKRETIAANAAIVEEDMKAIQARLVSLRQAQAPNIVAAVAKAETALQKFLPMVQQTMTLAAAVTGMPTIEQQDEIARSSLASAAAYMEARIALRELTQLQQARADETSKAAYAMANQMQFRAHRNRRRRPRARRPLRPADRPHGHLFAHPAAHRLPRRPRQCPFRGRHPRNPAQGRGRRHRPCRRDLQGQRHRGDPAA
jgi:methyl-accepting chemotaxis protein